MLTMRSLRLVLIALVSLSAIHLEAQQQAVARRIVVPADRLASTDAETRTRAYYEMVAAATAGRERAARTTNFLALQAREQDDLAEALISLLERENTFFASAPPGSISEDYGAGYYPDLFVTVARMKDSRALNALLPVISNGDVVTDALTEMGEPAVPGVIAMLNDQDALKRAGAALVLGRMAARKDLGLSSGATGSIKAALLRSVVEPNAYLVRKRAIEGLAPFSGADIRSVMERVAATDTVALKGRRGQANRFIVRDAAKSWLAKHPT